jgi:proline iminopeptidase
MENIAGRIPKGRFHLCPDGSHMAMYDDQEIYFDGLISFINDVERNASDQT